LIVLEGLERKPSLSRKIGDFARRQSPAIWIAATTLLAFVIRLIVVCCVFRGVTGPINAHAAFGFEMGWTARSIALGRGFSGPFQPLTGPTAIVPPLYPYLLAGIFHLFGLYSATSAFVALTLNSLLSALTCIPIYAAAREASGDRLARWAAFGWAIYPFAIFYSAANVWDYGITALLFACCFYWAARLHRSHGARSWILFGLLYGITALSNPSIVSLLPFLLWIAIRRSREIGVPSLKRAILALCTFALVLVPWTIRNERVMHTLTPLRDGFWLEFYAGNMGDPNNSNSPLAHPASNPAELRLYTSLGEKAYMAQKHDLAIATVRRHPGLFVESTARRIVRFWTGYWSLSPAYLQHEPLDLPNVPFCTGLAAFTLAGFVWLWRRDRSALLPFALLVVVFPLPYYFTHASMDYRAPIEPQLVILITAGVLAVRQRLTAVQRQAVRVERSDLDFVPS
jgi:4-amino-4-deoxy-L-arabinose transferase-like glycosyltransferase